MSKAKSRHIQTMVIEGLSWTQRVVGSASHLCLNGRSSVCHVAYVGARFRKKKKSGISRLLSGLKEFQRNSSVPHEDMAKYKRAMEVAEFDMEGAVAELEMIYLDLQPTAVLM